MNGLSTLAFWTPLAPADSSVRKIAAHKKENRRLACFAAYLSLGGPMLDGKTIVKILGTVLLAGITAISAPQAPAVRPVDENVLREYTGVYQWEPDAFVYLQMWEEFSGFGKPKL